MRPRTTCRSIRCMRRALSRSDARRARAPSRQASPNGPAAGGGKKKTIRSADCTSEGPSLSQSADGNRWVSASGARAEKRTTSTFLSARLRKAEVAATYRRPRALGQARAAESFQIVLALGILLDRHAVGDPGERDVGL